MKLLAAPAAPLALPAVGSVALDQVYESEFFATCAKLPAASVDMVLCDLPYGTIACSWDEIIPFEPMWSEFKRVIKPYGAIVLTASQPFTSKLVASNINWFRCEWVWRKPQGTGYLNANRQPMKNHESVLVFSRGIHNYFPQMREGKPYRATSGAVGGFVRDKTVGGYLTVNNGERYPLSVLDFVNETGLHPTQKPLDLFAYLIRTYTRPGELVFDPTCGSGTTAIAARNTGRRYVVADNGVDERTGKTWAEITRDRLAQPRTLPLFTDDAPAVAPPAATTTTQQQAALW